MAQAGLPRLLHRLRERQSTACCASSARAPRARSTWTPARVCRKYGIKIWANYMLGLPDRDPGRGARDTISMLKEIDPDYYSPAFYTPHPGSDLYDYCLENDLSLIASHDQYPAQPHRDQDQGPGLRLPAVGAGREPAPHAGVTAWDGGWTRPAGRCGATPTRARSCASWGGWWAWRDDVRQWEGRVSGPAVSVASGSSRPQTREGSQHAKLRKPAGASWLAGKRLQLWTAQLVRKPVERAIARRHLLHSCSPRSW